MKLAELRGRTVSGLARCRERIGAGNVGTHSSMRTQRPGAQRKKILVNLAKLRALGVARGGSSAGL